jgi:S-phase kinase-associated protein 1
LELVDDEMVIFPRGVGLFICSIIHRTKVQISSITMASAVGTSNNNNSNTAQTVSTSSASAVAPVSLDDGGNDDGFLMLISKDKKEFKIERKFAKMSKLIRTALENDEKEDTIPIVGVQSHILELVVQYLKEHKGVEPQAIEKPLRSKKMSDVCPYKWDATYIDKIGDTRQNLYDLVLAGNYLDIQPLLHLGCAKIASLIKGQPLEKFKEILDPKQPPQNSSSNSTSSSTSSSSTPASVATTAQDKKDYKDPK